MQPQFKFWLVAALAIFLAACGRESSPAKEIKSAPTTAPATSAGAVTVAPVASPAARATQAVPRTPRGELRIAADFLPTGFDPTKVFNLELRSILDG